MSERRSPELSKRALRAAVEVAEDVGLRFERPVVLRDRSNLLVHLWPAPVVPSGSTSRRPIGRWDAVDAGRGLRLCHEALANFGGELPRMAVLAEAERVVDKLANAGSLNGDDIALIRRVVAGVRKRVERLGLPMQAIHGDAHLGNVITTASGPLWNDWEDTFLGPVAWDLACLHASAPPFGHRDPKLISAARGAYGDRVDTQTLEAFVDARRFQVSVWGLVIGQAQADGQRVEKNLAWLRDRGRRAPTA